VPNSAKTLRLHTHGDVPLAVLRELLGDLEYAYNGAVAFDTILRRWTRDPDAAPSWLYYGWRRRSFGPLVLNRDEVAALVHPHARLRFHGARLASPGFFDFLGKSLSVEAISTALTERQKRREFTRQEPHRRRMETADEVDRETEVILGRYRALREMGVDADELTPLRNQLLERPFKELAPHVDSGLIEDVEVLEVADEPELEPGDDGHG
jgi:hypothetical protein